MSYDLAMQRKNQELENKKNDMVEDQQRMTYLSNVLETN